VGVKNVEAQAHRAINDDYLLGVFAHLGIQRDDEHLSLRLWCAPSKPIFDLPSAMTTGVEFILRQGSQMGLGLPVFWTCRRDDLDKLHFDIRSEVQCSKWVINGPDGLETPLPDYPEERTSSGSVGMSRMCFNQTCRQTIDHAEIATAQETADVDVASRHAWVDAAGNGGDFSRLSSNGTHDRLCSREKCRSEAA
jgi:hypothetical protein